MDSQKYTEDNLWFGEYDDYQQEMMDFYGDAGSEDYGDIICAGCPYETKQCAKYPTSSNMHCAQVLEF